MTQLTTLNTAKKLTQVLTNGQMSHIKGGTNQAPPQNPNHNPGNPLDGTCNVTEALDDDKRRTRPGGGGVTS